MSERQDLKDLSRTDIAILVHGLELIEETMSSDDDYTPEEREAVECLLDRLNKLIRGTS